MPDAETFVRQLMSDSEVIKTIIGLSVKTASSRINDLTIVQQFAQIYGDNLLPFSSVTIICQMTNKTKHHFNMDVLPREINGVEGLTMRINPNEILSPKKMKKYADIIQAFLSWKTNGQHIINQCVAALEESENKEEKFIEEMFEQEMQDKKFDISAKSFGIEKVSIASNYNFYNKDTRRLLIIIIDRKLPSFISDKRFNHSLFKFTLRQAQN